MYYGHTYVRRRDMDVGTLGGAHELPTHSTGTGTSTCHVYHVCMYVVCTVRIMCFGKTLIELQDSMMYV
jgi:hypothetical protein